MTEMNLTMIVVVAAVLMIVLLAFYQMRKSGLQMTDQLKQQQTQMADSILAKVMHEVTQSLNLKLANLKASILDKLEEEEDDDEEDDTDTFLVTSSPDETPLSTCFPGNPQNSAEDGEYAPPPPPLKRPSVTIQSPSAQRRNHIELISHRAPAPLAQAAARDDSHVMASN